MRIIFKIAFSTCTAVILGGSASACSSPPPPPVTSSAAPSTTGILESASTLGPTQSQADLTASLLSASELPGTYKETSPETSSAAQLGAGMQGCASGDNPTPQPRITAQGVFQSGVLGPFLAEVISASSERTAILTMSGLANLVQNCSHFGGKVSEFKVDFSIDPLTFPSLADGTAAFQLTATVENVGVAIYAHVVSVRTGNVVVTITLMQLASPDATVTEKIVRAALAKAEKRLHTSTAR
jgi:hypothetical protein